MDKEFQDLQKLWQAQESAPIDIQGLIQDLNKIEQQSRKERIYLKWAIPGTAFVLLALAFGLPQVFMTYIIGISMIILGMFMIYYLLYTQRMEKIKENQKISNKEFLEIQIAKLRQRMRVTSHYMWVYALLLIGGINIAYLGALSAMEMPQRWMAHVGVTVVMIILFYITIRIRMKKYGDEIIPLITKLESLKEED